MESRKTVLLCDHDYAHLNHLQDVLESIGFDVDTIDDASQLIPSAIRLQPSLVLINPEMEGFHAEDVCQYIIREKRVHVILTLDPASAHTAALGSCRVEDILTKPVQAEDVEYLFSRYLALY